MKKIRLLLILLLISAVAISQEGSILKLPAITVLAIANSNLNEVIEKSSWLAVDVALMFVGVGELKAAFTVGNTLRKTFVVADLAGSTIGIGLQGTVHNIV